jgi:hypothetical protein
MMSEYSTTLGKHVGLVVIIDLIRQEPLVISLDPLTDGTDFDDDGVLPITGPLLEVVYSSVSMVQDKVL